MGQPKSSDKIDSLVRFENLELHLRNCTSSEASAAEIKPKVLSWYWGDLQLPSTAQRMLQLPLQQEPLIPVGNTSADEAIQHRNGVSRVDHVVLRTTDCKRLAAELSMAGLTLARERSDLYPGITQMFFKTGKVDSHRGAVLEIVGPTTAESQNTHGCESDAGTSNHRSGGFFGIEPEGNSSTGNYKVSLWGLGLESQNIDSTWNAATPHCSEVRSAVQTGRRILTLKPEQPTGLALAVLSARDNSSTSLASAKL